MGFHLWESLRYQNMNTSSELHCTVAQCNREIVVNCRALRPYPRFACILRGIFSFGLLSAGKGKLLRRAERKETRYWRCSSWLEIRERRWWECSWNVRRIGSFNMRKLLARVVQSVPTHVNVFLRFYYVQRWYFSRRLWWKGTFLRCRETNVLLIDPVHCTRRRRQFLYCQIGSAKAAE